MNFITSLFENGIFGALKKLGYAYVNWIAIKWLMDTITATIMSFFNTTYGGVDVLNIVKMFGVYDGVVFYLSCMMIKYQILTYKRVDTHTL